jgi:AcrR family transcriptional regulator
VQEERKRIIEAALEEFVEKGISCSNLDAVAARAQLDPGVVRALFVDKSNLLKELYKEKTEPMVSAICIAVQEIEDPKELVRKSLEHLDNWLLMHPKVIRLYMQSSLEESDALETTYQQHLVPSELFERMNQMIEQGKIRCKNILVLGYILDALILMFHMMLPGMRFLDPNLSIEEIARLRLEAIFDLLENGLYSN